MNIFVLDRDPAIAARYHCDKHVVKMILETVQMLMTTAHHYGLQDIPYKPTHVNHPCTVWARQSEQNLLWLNQLGRHLVFEWRYRWGHAKDHKAWDKWNAWLDQTCYSIIRKVSWPHSDLTPFAQAMPQPYKDKDPITAYRSYYLYEKAPILTYTKRDLPPWMEEDV